MNTVMALVIFGILGAIVVAAIMILWGKRSLPPQITTGLRVVDLFFPIERGTNTLISGDPKAGARVFGTEIMYRLMHHPHEKLQVVYFIDAQLPDLEDWKKELVNTIPELMDYKIVEHISSAQLVTHIRSGGIRPQIAAFMLTFRQSLLDEWTSTLQQTRAELSPKHTVTGFSVSEENSAGPYAMKMIVSKPLASGAIYPAVDLKASQGKPINPVAESAKRLIEEVITDFYPEAINDPQWQYNTDNTLRPALQLLLYQSQSFHIAEPYTGLPGTFVPIDDATSDIQNIIEGKFVSLPNASFRFRNSLPS